MLIQSGKIIDALKRVDFEDSEIRQLLPGPVSYTHLNRMEYEHLIPVLNYFAIKLGQSMSGKKEEQT